MGGFGSSVVSKSFAYFSGSMIENVAKAHIHVL